MTRCSLLAWTGGSPPSLEEAQEVVGGYVEMIRLPNGDQLLVDEDGRRKGLRINHDATALVVGSGARGLGWGFGVLGPILGPALVLKGAARWVDGGEE